MNIIQRSLCLILALNTVLLVSCAQAPAAVVASSTPAPPTALASIVPTLTASPMPTQAPTATMPAPTQMPSATAAPSPTATNSPLPTKKPTARPSAAPTAQPTAIPTAEAVRPSELRYVFPVQAAKGKISYGAEHHDYPATDIFCPIGSHFVAPTDGVIDFVSHEDLWNPQKDQPALRGGISVAMIGDDGVRYYGSHLSQVAEGIEPGVRVEAGQLLGLTGKSGNARSTPPHVHFGISQPTTADDWQTRRGQVSPFRYLKAWARGEMITPVLK